MSQPIVAEHDEVTFFISDREPIFVVEVNPVGPFVLGELSVVTEGHLQVSVKGMKILDTGPVVEPRVVVSNGRVQEILANHGSILEGIDVVSRLHVSFFALPVFAPSDFESRLFCTFLSFLGIISHEGGLPVVVDS
jgi:hypothetical protein